MSVYNRIHVLPCCDCRLIAPENTRIATREFPCFVLFQYIESMVAKYRKIWKIDRPAKFVSFAAHINLHHLHAKNQSGRLSVLSGYLIKKADSEC